MNFNAIRRWAAVTVIGGLLAACGGAPAQPTQAVYDPAVAPFSAEQAAPYVTIANASGVLPCGVFDVKGHGQKVATLSDFTTCAGADFTIACLNGEAQWTGEFISEVSIESGTVNFTSAQDGICALFPAE